MAALAIAAPVALAIGLLLAPLALAGLILVVLVRLARIAGAWIWFLATRGRRPDYPLRLRVPVTPVARREALRDVLLTILPAVAGGGARLAAPLLAPTALLISALGLAFPSLRARPYLRVFTPPHLVAKAVSLGQNRGWFLDGERSDVGAYDEWLEGAFPEIPHFLDWWRSGDPRPYTPVDPTPIDSHVGAAGLGRLELGPHPDPLGYPGLALGAMRRRGMRGLRELIESQRDIDDRGDPDLDERADAGVIRIVSRQSDAGGRVWIVQIPSTQSFDPRAGLAPNDITAGLIASSGGQPTLARAALDAMTLAGIRPGEPVLISGFSLGGIVATELARLSARSGHSVTHVVTSGAPTGRARVPEGVRVLSFEHALDLVPRLDGRRNPIGRWVTVSSGPPVFSDYRFVATHHIPSYAETAGAIEDDPGDERLADFLASATGFFGPGQVVRDFAATRSGAAVARPAVPFVLRGAEEDGVTTRTLRAAFRRVAGVVAVDIYPSRVGYPTTIVWAADILVERFDPWFDRVDRRILYRGLIALLVQRRAVGIHLQIQARDEPDATWEATLQRAGDGSWRERVDVSFGSVAAERRCRPFLDDRGAGSRVVPRYSLAD